MIVSDGRRTYQRYVTEAKITRNGTFIQVQYTEDGVMRFFQITEKDLRKFLDGEEDVLGLVGVQEPLDARTILLDLVKTQSFRNILEG